MTKKDYVIIAKVLREQEASPALVARMAFVLGRENLKFDAEKFRTAATKGAKE